MIVKLATIIAGVSTALSAWYLRNQGILQKKEWLFKQPRPSIAIINNPEFWHSLDKTYAIEVENTGNTNIVIHDFLLRIKNILESKNIGGSNLINDFCKKPVSLKSGESTTFEILSNELPKNVPIFIEIRYKSGHDNYERLIFYEDKETRVIK